MKEILIIIVLMFITNYCSAQVKYDKVVVYFTTGYPTGGIIGTDENDEKEWRRKAHFVLKVKEKNEIEELESVFLLNEYIKDKSGPFFNSVFLIDFMIDGEIIITISVSRRNNIRLDEQEMIYQPNEKVSAFVEQYESFFRQIMD